jgi:S-formylglutathione hydrolase FrmB
VWVPPIASSSPGTPLPVVQLLHGTPGGPADWVRAGVVGVLDAFAAEHGGRAPVVVMPDINGARHTDTECVRTSYGADVERYLTDEVPRWVAAHFAVHGGRSWGVVGLSEGGTCAAMLALRHPARYAALGDFSGLDRPTVGDRDDPARTVSDLFAGSRTAYDRHDPLWLLAHDRYPRTSAWIEYGTSDRAVSSDCERVAAAALASGVDVHVERVAGGHEWPVWIAALRAMLPWLAGRLA